MEWYYYAILFAIIYPILAISIGNFYWYMFNKYMTMISRRYVESCGANPRRVNIFCQRKPSLLFKILFYPDCVDFQAGYEGYVYPDDGYKDLEEIRGSIEQIYRHSPDNGYDKGKYVAKHLWLMPLKLVKSLFVIFLFLLWLCFKIIAATYTFILRLISWISGSASQNKKLAERAQMIKEGRSEDVIAKANPKKFRAPKGTDTTSPAKRLKEIVVEAANLEAERLKLEEQLQAEEDAQAGEAGARVYQLKASNGD